MAGVVQYRLVSLISLTTDNIMGCNHMLVSVTTSQA